MRTRLFIVSVLTLGLVTLGAVASFADVSDTATISASVGAAESVAMGDLGFGSLSVGYTKGTPSPALTFNSNYASNALRIWTDNAAGQGMVSGTDIIPLRYFFDIDGDASTDPATTWGTDWTEVSNVPATPNVLYNLGPIDKSTAGNATLDFATLIGLATPEGTYSTTLNLEIIHP